jgi:hypothetical protein
LSDVKGLSAGASISVPINRLSRLLPIGESEDAPGARLNVKGQALEKLFGDEESFAFYGERRLDVLICGVSADLYEESKSLQLGVGDKDISALHLLRPRAVFGARTGFRSDVVTALQRPRPQGGDMPSLVVFDGAYSYQQWWRVWKDVPAIVVLDDSASARARITVVLDRIRSLRERGCYLKDLVPDDAPSQMEILAVSY